MSDLFKKYDCKASTSMRCHLIEQVHCHIVSRAKRNTESKGISSCYFITESHPFSIALKIIPIWTELSVCRNPTKSIAPYCTIESTLA
ncbi:hypothetical protein QR680_011959 [Steinernema hermaphroditum]|uniref:Uncharacterized protein n=1 Tax=Steinernema hermaphroditum TaxID=289476 RepID=A0AA39LYZ5_9BILA|nr:hypothetical protein QR680_011959 [Steinernema hermaphroditum]